MNYKGFDKKFSCNGFQYEVGKTYRHRGKISLCEEGFHSCEKPLDVLKYYYPTSSRYALVQIGGEIIRGDDKTVSTEITVIREITLPELIAAATAGDYSHAATVGPSSHAATAGPSSHAATAGVNSIACAIGRRARAKAARGSYIVLSEYDSEGNVVCVRARKIDGKRLKPNTWYRLKNGKFERVEI